jgi:predicted dithiol-disulfide oxidoreductase (DUF899 family)
MTTHKTASREEWLAARKELLADEKEHTRRGDELARRRRELPWVLVEKDYSFETDEGTKTLAELFGGRPQLIVYHFMFGPNYESGCPACSSIADGFSGIVEHLEQRGAAMSAISRAPLAKINAFKQRMGWTFPWASSFGSDFNYDFEVSRSLEELRAGGYEYNFREWPGMTLDDDEDSGLARMAAASGTVVSEYVQEGPGMSVFALSDGAVYHTYSAFARGLDGLWGAYQWLDRTPLGRNEADLERPWMRRDEYARA